MRKPTVAALLAAVLAIGPFNVAAPAQAVAMPSPVLDIAFDEGSGTTASDSATGEHDATLTAVEWVGGQAGSAIRLDGDGARADISSNGLHHLDALHVQHWVRADEPPAVGAVILQAGADECEATFGLYAREDGVAFSVSADGGPLSGELVFGQPWYPEVELWDGAWHHVAAGTDMWGNMRLAVDAFGLGRSGPGVDFTEETNDGISLGEELTGVGCGRPAFAGDIDDLRLYPANLEREEIGSLLPPVTSTVTLADPDPIHARSMGQCVLVTVDPAPPGGRARVELRDSDGALAGTFTSGGTCYGHPLLPRGTFGVTLDVDQAGDYEAIAFLEPGLPWLPAQSDPQGLTIRRREVSTQLFIPNVMPGQPIPADVVVGFGASDDRAGTVTLVDVSGGVETVVGSGPVMPVPSSQNGAVSFVLPGRPAGDYVFEAQFSGTANLWAPGTASATIDIDDTLGWRGPVTFGFSPTYWSHDVLDVYAPAEKAQYVEVREPGGQWFRQGYHLPVIYPFNTFAATPRDGPITIQVRWQDDGGRFSEIQEATQLLTEPRPRST